MNELIPKDDYDRPEVPIIESIKRRNNHGAT